MHMADPCVEHITDLHVIECRQALDTFAQRTDLERFYGSVDQGQQKSKDYISSLHQLHVVLYHRGQVKNEPQLHRDRSHLRVFTIHQPRMQQTLENYLLAHHLPDEPATVEGLDYAVRRFAVWLERVHPELETFAQVTREHVLAYAEALDREMGACTKRPLTAGGKRHLLTKLTQFFREVTEWGWQDVPDHFLLLETEIPKLPVRLPRYIPDEELGRLMVAIRSLGCPYQRAALLIARWSGARRGEIRRLGVHCLDSFPDGTPRLHIPTGKTHRERLIPIHEEAASVMRERQARHRGERGFRDPKTGVVTQYLFMQKGALLSETYLFATSLQKACQAAGLVTPDGKPTITPHRFRHTIGTHLARRGARFRTIQKILGHESATMSMRYIDLTDEEVRQDYQAVLGPGAILAGPGAEAVQSGQLAPDEVAWIANNLDKTELELGRCLRLPGEGPCECDLYLTCAKFVTSPEYAPRLRRRRRIEQELVKDAYAHGWQREVERHQCTIQRLEQLLKDLGEPIDGLEATD
jgi:integrase